MNAIIITGNPVDGLEFYGPFSSQHEASEFANRDASLPSEWWTAPLHDPGEPEVGSEPGSLVSGTLRRQDLIPAFLAEYKRLVAGANDVHIFRAIQGYETLIPGNCDSHEWWNSEEAADLLEELHHHLNELAPPGHYFGTHIGDGSDFGFWPDEESE